MAKTKICILHDFFLYRWGAERFNVMAAKTVGADLAAAYFDSGSFDLDSMGFSGRKIVFSRRLFPESGSFPVGALGVLEKAFSRILPDKIRRILRYLHFVFAVRWKTAFLREYGTVVFSGDTLGAVRNCQKSALKICYFHSIPRYLFDQKALYLSKVPFWLRPAYRVARHFSTRAFFGDLSKIDRIYVNGKNLQSYCLEHLGRESDIIYPPVDTAEFQPCEPEEKGDHYLSFSKLATLKRVDMVVRAFREMPDKKLLVVHGTNDPQKDEILELARGASNIECRVLADNAELPKIVASAIATVFVSKNEDFWMVAIESMSAGTPVIAADSGGLRETVVAGVTGTFVPEAFSITDLKNAVFEMTPERARSMREKCVERALEFWKERFEGEIRKAFTAQ